MPNCELLTMNAIRRERWLWNVVTREYCREGGDELYYADKRDEKKLARTKFTYSFITYAYSFDNFHWKLSTVLSTEWELREKINWTWILSSKSLCSGNGDKNAIKNHTAMQMWCGSLIEVPVIIAKGHPWANGHWLKQVSHGHVTLTWILIL